MYFLRKLIGLFVLGFLIVGLLGAIGNTRHNRYETAYQQGFTDGQQAAAAKGETAAESSAPAAAVPPTGNSGTQVYYRGHGFFFPGFGLLFCLVPLFFFGMMIMFFGKHRHYRRHRRWGHHRSGYGPCAPWGPQEGWEGSPKEKSPEDIDDGPDETIRRA